MAMSNRGNTPSNKGMVMQWKSLFGQDKGSVPPVREPWTFDWYSVGFRAHNTLRCSVIYDQREQMLHRRDEPSGPPKSSDWLEHWNGGYMIRRDRAFSMPAAQFEWESMSGERHADSLVLQDLFPGRAILHDVPAGEIFPNWEPSGRVEILVEIDDRAIRVYMRSKVATIRPQVPGNPQSHSRWDAVLGWSREY